MSTTPKPLDEGTIAAGERSGSALEQTVMGIAPPPSGVTGAPLLVPPSPAAAAEDAGAALVAAPTIAVAATEDRIPDPPASALPGGSALAPVASSVAAEAKVGDTLPLERSGPPSVPRPAPRNKPPEPQRTEPLEPQRTEPLAPQRTEHLEPQRSEPLEPQRTEPLAGAPGLEQTALSADYLRAARDAALSQLAAVPSAPSEPQQARNGQDAATPPAAAAGPSVTDPAPFDASAHLGTRPSIAPPHLSAVPTPLERTAPTATRGFEPVPVIRAPLAESLSSALGPIAELGGHRPFAPSARPRPVPIRPRETGGRWLLLGSVALATVGIVTLGSRLMNRYRSSASRSPTSIALERPSEAASGAAPADASRALLANLPAPQRSPSEARAQVVSATGSPAGRQPNGADSSGAAASPESQLAAAAGRHVLAGNYAEALPLYRQLEQAWPANTAYAAMARLLEQRLGSTNDTLTVTPAPVAPAKVLPAKVAPAKVAPVKVAPAKVAPVTPPVSRPDGSTPR